MNNKDDKVYCGLEGSICYKGLEFETHSPCCLKCRRKCKACTVKDISQCKELCSKEDIVNIKVEELNKEKTKYTEIINDLDKQIEKLYKELL